MVDNGRADSQSELAERRRNERLAVEEAGGGQSEGFELTEQELIQHASHGDEQTLACVMYDAVPEEEEEASSVYSEADEERRAD
jgi:hypothetical protein